MLNFIEHPAFEREKGAAMARFHFGKDFEQLKKLLLMQFSPTEPLPVIGPGKIHRKRDFVEYQMWKVEMSVKGLRKNQGPRIWFGVKGTTLVFVCLKTHIDNYDDNTVDVTAESLMTDFF
jgi:hypothetical protein